MDRRRSRRSQERRKRLEAVRNRAEALRRQRGNLFEGEDLEVGDPLDPEPQDPDDPTAASSRTGDEDEEHDATAASFGHIDQPDSLTDHIGQPSPTTP